eukprot:204193-Pelagomonas_calceolata.AAC.8
MASCSCKENIALFGTSCTCVQNNSSCIRAANFLGCVHYEHAPPMVCRIAQFFFEIRAPQASPPPNYSASSGMSMPSRSSPLSTDHLYTLGSAASRAGPCPGQWAGMDEAVCCPCAAHTECPGKGHRVGAKPAFRQSVPQLRQPAATAAAAAAAAASTATAKAEHSVQPSGQAQAHTVSKDEGRAEASQHKIVAGVLIILVKLCLNGCQAGTKQSVHESQRLCTMLTWNTPTPHVACYSTNAGFKGLPIPSNETESDRKLREDITRDVFRYFEESGKQLMAQRGQKIPDDEVVGVQPPALWLCTRSVVLCACQYGLDCCVEPVLDSLAPHRGPPAFSPKMQAFCQIVGFKMYMGARSKVSSCPARKVFSATC